MADKRIVGPAVPGVEQRPAQRIVFRGREEREERRGGEKSKEMRGGVCGLAPRREEGDEEEGVEGGSEKEERDLCE